MLLTIDDYAGNYVSARRFILHDDVSTLNTSTVDELWVDSAAANSSYTWITELDYQVALTVHTLIISPNAIQYKVIQKTTTTVKRCYFSPNTYCIGPNISY